MGPFIGYQLAIDLNYSPLLNFSEDDFVEPGPGALDGIAKCFSSLGDLSPADVIRYMTHIQEQAFEKYAPGFRTLWGRRLHLIDCQNLFCEVGKYARVAHIRSSRDYRTAPGSSRYIGHRDAPAKRPGFPLNGGSTR